MSHQRPLVVGARLRAMRRYREGFIARKRAPTELSISAWCVLALLMLQTSSLCRHNECCTARLS
ncbi:hypothetical protein EIQ28_01290 [Xanthomonas campestris pv. plantaginis]